MTPRQAIASLSAAGVPDAKNDVLLLLSAVSGRSLASLMFSLDEDISGEPYYSEFGNAVTRRKSREPLQYIIGKWSFYGDEYKVSPACLIPRPDTETIVDEALAILPRGAHIADLCCGSGCIGIAILKNSDATCDSFDISPDAISIARENASSLGVSHRITFTVGDVFSPSLLSKKYGLIVSNPPYIRHKDVSALAPELAYEPSIALDGGTDGMDFYRAIVKNFVSCLADGGAFVFEIGYDQAEEISAVAKENSMSARIVCDLEDRPRAAILRRLM